MLHLNDTLCRINHDGSLEFGRAIMPRKDEGGATPTLDLKTSIPVTWSNGDSQVIDKKNLDGHIGLVSRKLKAGDRVKVSQNGKIGHVVGVSEFATLRCAENPEVIYKDIPLERLSTIMKFYGYPGAHILYGNWIGMVLSAKRRITYSHDDDIFFSVTDQSENAVQVAPWMDPHSISNSSMLYPGKQFTFTAKMCKQGKFDSVWGHMKSIPLIGKVFIVETIEIMSVTVQWLCPANIFKQNENCWENSAIPDKVIEGSSLDNIKDMGIPSYLLATNGSGRIFQVTKGDIPVSDTDWQLHFAKEVFPQQMRIFRPFAGAGHQPEKKKMKPNDNCPSPGGNPAQAQGSNPNSKESTTEKLNEIPETEQINEAGEKISENLEGTGKIKTGNNIIEKQIENSGDIANNKIGNSGDTAENKTENSGDTAGKQTENSGDISGKKTENSGDTAGKQTENSGDTAGKQTENSGDTTENKTENSGDTDENKTGSTGDNGTTAEMLNENSEANVAGKMNAKGDTNNVTVQVLFIRQVANILFDDITTEHIDSLACFPHVDVKKEQSDFLFPFGCWVQRKRCQFYDEEDSIYGVVIQVISASKVMVEWTQTIDEELISTVEECWNYDLLLHGKFNSLCRGGIVLWDIWQCGVIVDNLSLDFKITIRHSSGEILKMKPHEVQAIEYHGFWDVLQQKWLVRDFDAYLNELRLNPYDQSEDTFTNRVDVIENVPMSHSYFKVEIPYGDPQENVVPFANTVLKEMLFLEKHLPDGIWIQFYLDRLDLVSAVIRGAKGTPYESGLFFFDIKIPIMYPAAPPQVCFVTFGGKNEINPNFDASSGRICSSLLETVSDGCYAERWTKTSNIMQILLSIQALYLCEHPLFNKPAYSLLPSYQQSSHSKPKKDLELSQKYNNNIRENLVLYYAQVLRDPPSHWRSLIVSHFFESLESLLESLKVAKVIPKAFKLDLANSEDIFDDKIFSTKITDATIHFELILQDVKENKWQLFPRY